MQSSQSNFSTSDENRREINAFCHDYLQYYLPLSQVKENNQDYIEPIIPTDISVLLERYVMPDLYQDTLKEIRKAVSGHKLFVSMSISCDGQCKKGHNDVVNVTIGTLKSSEPGQVFMINSVPKSSDSTEFYLKVFNESLSILWPGNVSLHSKELLMLLTDDVPGMTSAACQLRNTYSSMFHLLSVDQSLHRFEQNVKSVYQKAGNIMDAVYLLIFESIELGPMTKAQFCSKLSLPKPFPFVYNSNENFLEMAIYVLDNFDRFKNYCADNNTKVATELHEMFRNEDYRKELDSIKSKYSPMISVMSLLRSKPIPTLSRSIRAVEDFQAKLQQFPNEQNLCEILSQLLAGNSGYQAIRHMSQNSEFKYAPLVVQDRYRFHRFHIFKQMIERIPVKYFFIYSVLYCYREETYNQNGIYRKYKTWKFLDDNMIGKDVY